MRAKPNQTNQTKRSIDIYQTTAFPPTYTFRIRKKLADKDESSFPFLLVHKEGHAFVLPSANDVQQLNGFAAWSCSIALPTIFYTLYPRRPHATLSTPVMQASSKDPLEIVARLDRLY
ncbi:hypothetical protein WG66_003227 [Moniliophthora roreri]|nr:hypothetical protein WG66_003227 [Moniliophthora roreri]